MSKRIAVPHELWPVTIMQDRYTGAYAGGEWIAVAKEDAMIPGGRMTRLGWVLDGAYDDDGGAMMFWEAAHDESWLAVGDTPDAALERLIRKHFIAVNKMTPEEAARGEGLR